MEIKDVVSLLKSEMIPAMGCTEPAASALAGAKARELIGEDRIKSVAVFASRDIVKNAMGVGIPDCERRGILTAVALGIAKGDSSKDLNILSDLTQEEVNKAASLSLTQVRRLLSPLRERDWIWHRDQALRLKFFRDFRFLKVKYRNRLFYKYPRYIQQACCTLLSCRKSHRLLREACSNPS